MLCAAVLAGCGDDGPQVRYLGHPRVIRQSQVDRYASGTPERAALEWGRSVLYADAITAAGLYDPALRITPRALARQLERLQPVVTLFRSTGGSG